MTRFNDRRDAGRQLAKRLQRFAGRSDVIVVGLPRGGVPVAFEVGRALRTPLEILSVRKIEVPGHEDISIGAIATSGLRSLEAGVIDALRISREEVERASQSAMLELRQRNDIYRRGRRFPEVTGLVIIVVDDGLATGATMAAAVRSLRSLNPARIVVAAPVGAADVCARLRCLADDCVLALAPFPFQRVSDWYVNFARTTDEDVLELSRLADVPLSETIQSQLAWARTV